MGAIVGREDEVDVVGKRGRRRGAPWWLVLALAMALVFLEGLHRKWDRKDAEAHEAAIEGMRTKGELLRIAATASGMELIRVGRERDVLRSRLDACVPWPRFVDDPVEPAGD